MGSTSDWDVMSDAAATLAQFGVEFEKRVVSAHRTPDLLVEYAKTAKSRGLEVIIAGAGGAAHLPGMVASMTALPVIGVPVKSRALNGLDSLLSIVQMPGGRKEVLKDDTAEASAPKEETQGGPDRRVDPGVEGRGAGSPSGDVPCETD